jgi:hypothetical protein
VFQQYAGRVPEIESPFHCHVYGPRAPHLDCNITVIVLPTREPVSVGIISLFVLPVMAAPAPSTNVTVLAITFASQPVVPDGLRLGKLILPAYAPEALFVEGVVDAPWTTLRLVDLQIVLRILEVAPFFPPVTHMLNG